MGQDTENGEATDSAKWRIPSHGVNGTGYGEWMGSVSKLIYTLEGQKGSSSESYIQDV